MTDETYTKIVEHVKEHALPPCPPLVAGWGVDIYVDQGRADDDVEFKPHSITMSPADYAELKILMPARTIDRHAWLTG